MDSLRIETREEMPLSSHPPHLMRWFNEFRDADLIKKLQNEKASLMAEVEDLKTKEEKHKIAKAVLMAEKGFVVL